jgi:hypothetical protein
MVARKGEAVGELLTSLKTGNETKRVEAAALLGWVRNADSIGALRAAYDENKSPALRRQLVFDVGAIVLSEGNEPADAQLIQQLATLHLARMAANIAAGEGPASAAGLLRAQTVVMHPSRVTPGFSVRVPNPNGAKLADGSQAAQDFHTPATPDDFYRATSQSGAWGIHFLPFHSFGEWARAGAVIVPPGSEPLSFAWVHLYRREGDHWVAWPDEAPDAGKAAICASNLCPTLTHDYRRSGFADPLKLQTVETLLEEVRADPPLLVSEKVFRLDSIPSVSFDRADAGLFEKYRNSDNPLVRAAAEQRLFELTGNVPDPQALLGALTVPASEYVRLIALGHVGGTGDVPIDVSTDLIHNAKNTALRNQAVEAYGATVLAQMTKGILPAEEASNKYGRLTGESRSAMLWDIAATLAGRDLRDACFLALTKIAEAGLKVYGEHGREKEKTAVVTQLPSAARGREIVDVLFWGDFASIETRLPAGSDRDAGGTYLFGQGQGQWYLLGARGWMR